MAPVGHRDVFAFIIGILMKAKVIISIVAIFLVGYWIGQWRAGQKCQSLVDVLRPGIAAGTIPTA